MVTKKKPNKPDLMEEDSLTEVRKAGSKRYDLSIRYRDGGVDKYYGVKSININGNVLEVVDGSNIFIGIVLDIVSYYNVEEA